MEKKINLTARRGSERDPPVSRVLVRDPAVGGGMEEPAGPAAGSGKAIGAGQAAGGGMEVVDPAAGRSKVRGAGQVAGSSFFLIVFFFFKEKYSERRGEYID